MKPFSAIMLTAIALLFLIFLGLPASADAISVGDFTQPGDFPLVHEQDEILAPVLQGLSQNKYNFLARGKSLSLLTPAGREIELQVGKRSAVVDGAPVELRAAPRYIDYRCYLPVNSLADALGMVVSWDASSGKLLLQPKLALLKVEDGPESVKVNLAAQVPLLHKEGRLSDPPRMFVDLDNLVLETNQKLAVNSGALLGVRAAPRGETGQPDLRVVLDLSREIDGRIKVGKNGCQLTVEIPKKATPQPTPAKIALKEILLASSTDKRAILDLSLSAATLVDASMERNQHLVVRIYRAANQVKQLPAIPTGGLISDMELRSLGVAGEVQELDIKLKKAVHHVLLSDGNNVRIVLGEFSLSGLKVVIDPGHGGRMSGAVGRTGLMEKDVNLAIGLELEKLLTDAGANAIPVRREDCSLRPIANVGERNTELRMRTALANTENADLYIAIHCNANGPNGHRTGTEIYYGNPFSRMLAESIHDQMAQILGRKDGGIIQKIGFVVIRTTNMPAVLVEVAYIDDAEEEKLLATEEFQARAAKAIFAGIADYVASGGPLGPQKAPTTPVVPATVTVPVTNTPTPIGSQQ